MQFASIPGPILLPAPVRRTHRTTYAMTKRAQWSESLNGSTSRERGFLDRS